MKNIIIIIFIVLLITGCGNNGDIVIEQNNNNKEIKNTSYNIDENSQLKNNIDNSLILLRNKLSIFELSNVQLTYKETTKEKRYFVKFSSNINNLDFTMLFDINTNDLVGCTMFFDYDRKNDEKILTMPIAMIMLTNKSLSNSDSIKMFENINSNLTEKGSNYKSSDYYYDGLNYTFIINAREDYANYSFLISKPL